ncbi:MAG: DNA topoisomerase 1 [Gemmatimonadota bacterium]|nr:MAG: DNA topoisomerase 1 [Gemmatimonadota bacterium]
MPKSLVIVESPTKAKTLGKFLGKDYVVTSSVGHVRDLPAKAADIPPEYKKNSWARMGVNVEEDFAPLYIVHPEKKKTIAELKRLVKTVDEVLLATDEDREGEAISWHLLEVLKPKVPVKRMVFHEITKKAILQALEDTRHVDQNLVSAQETRRIIDRLYGYEVSPILWRKVAPKLSAGRVQSVAVRLVVDREAERIRFRRAQYWDLTATFTTHDAHPGEFDTRLHSINGQRLANGKDFNPDTGLLARDNVVHLSQEDADQLQEALKAAAYRVSSTEEKPFTRSPAPPFSTSTLQQEGSRKLRFDAKRTMRAAQQLYENGFITYMRTDSVILSAEAVNLVRSAIESQYGKEYLPAEPREYKSKVKNAQEAHEAIRPAGEKIAGVEEVRGKLGADAEKVYELIWKRTLACQMKNAQGRRMTIQVAAKAQGKDILFQATGNVIDFPGFLRAYVEGSDDPEAALSEKETILPPVKVDDPLTAKQLIVEEHETSPPARLTEASLVKLLEEEGIGRPSTYASIIDTILRRNYVFKKGSALVPTFTAFAVIRLMKVHLTELIDVGFTARMEDRLDEISRGELESLPYLKSFYFGNGMPGLHPLLEKKLEEIDARSICANPIGVTESGEEIVVRVGRYGPYLQNGEGTATLPDGLCPDELSVERALEILRDAAKGDEPLGNDPETNLPIYRKSGRFGPYVQLGDLDPNDKKNKPKTSSLLAGMSIDTLTLEDAIRLLSLPRTLGQDEAGVDVIAHNGRFGPYIKRGDDTRSLAAEDHVLEIQLPRALELLAQEKKGRGFRKAAAPLKTFEKVEALDGADVRLLSGRYGPYVTDGDVNASLPRDIADPLTLEVERAVELILARREARGVSGKKKTKSKAKKKAKSKAKTKAKKKSKAKAKTKAKTKSKSKAKSKAKASAKSDS